MFARVNKHPPASAALWFYHWAGVHGDSAINTELAHMEKNLIYSLERHEEEGQGCGEGKKKNRKGDAVSKNSVEKMDTGSDLFRLFLAENYLYQLCRHRSPFTLLRADQI